MVFAALLAYVFLRSKFLPQPELVLPSYSRGSFKRKPTELVDLRR
jgi:hypothetical protein